MFSVREYQLDDRANLDRMMTILQNFFTEIDDFDEHREFDQSSAHAYIDEVLGDTKKLNGKILVAEKDGKVCGFIQGVILETDDLQHEKQKEGWVGLLFVMENMRKQGIGEGLLAEMKNYFEQQSCKVMKLKVLSSNANAIKVYQKIGFKTQELEMVVCL